MCRPTFTQLEMSGFLLASEIHKALRIELDFESWMQKKIKDCGLWFGDYWEIQLAAKDYLIPNSTFMVILIFQTNDNLTRVIYEDVLKTVRKESRKRFTEYARAKKQQNPNRS